LWLVVIGIFGYTRPGVDLYPQIDFPIVAVVTVQMGTSPEEIESDITDKVERAVSTISGIDELRPASSEGVSQALVKFLPEMDVGVAAAEVRDKIGPTGGPRPKAPDPPTVLKAGPDAAPVAYLALPADRPIREVSELADKVVRRELEGVAGVGDVRIVGGRL